MQFVSSLAERNYNALRWDISLADNQVDEAAKVFEAWTTDLEEHVIHGGLDVDDKAKFNEAAGLLLEMLAPNLTHKQFIWIYSWARHWWIYGEKLSYLHF